MGKRLTVVLGTLLVVFGGLFIYSNLTKVDSSDLRSQYPNLATNHVFKEFSGQEIVDTLNNGTGVVFLGFKECPWCQKLAPLADEAARAAGLDEVMYLDIRKSRQDNDDTYQQLVDRLSDYLEKDEDGEPRVYVPDVSVVKDGEIVGRFEQEDAPQSESTPDTFWTDARQTRAIQQLTTHMEKIK